MSLKLYFHPLSSFCQKALIALYESGASFERHFLDLMDEKVHADYRALWPIGKMPLLRDEAKNLIVPEATIIIEYLASHHPGAGDLVPRDPEGAWQVRLRDRLYDLYVNDPVQKIVTDRIRPDGARDSHGVEQARAVLARSYDVIEQEMATRTWAMGDVFTMADCAAAPALYYANLVAPFGQTHTNVAAYFERLLKRPSFARVVDEAEPYRRLFPSS
jgi:glutathione S-transferase